MAEVEGPLDAPVLHSSQVPTICTMTCVAENRRSADLFHHGFDVGIRNSDDR
jgi:hypothetical protein